MAKNGGGNSHQRKLLETQVARQVEVALLKTRSAPSQTGTQEQLQVTPSSLAPGLIKFVEQPLFLAAFGILGGIVGLIYTPFLAVVGLCILGAFHRAHVVTGRSWKVQVPSYFLVFAGAVACVYGATVAIKKAVHVPTAQEIAHAISADNKSFVQFEDRREMQFPKLGDYWRINFYYVTRGSRPIKDVQSAGMIVFVDPKTNPPQQIKKVWFDAAAASYKKGQGIDAGDNIPLWNTAVSNEILTDKIERGLRDGTLRVFYLTEVTWASEASEINHTEQCYWSDWVSFPNPNAMVWHSC
ncbi:hypothetical protein [Tunturiibacter lichenicola]|uniref:hypothetical protein n=1 Tax=Tunturiibacter lichenicola TaxID=2051959 RepID=UPI0021B47D75|nr:hypothetical protein [Edaphobacter lichenicola]